MKANPGAGNVQVTKLELTLLNGTALNIIQMFSEITIQEDIFANSISGSITIVDQFDLISTSPIVGQELITFEMNNPVLDEIHKVKYTGVIYKIGERVRTTTAEQVYNLYFTSVESATNENKKISKYFTGNIAKNIADIFKDKKYLASNKTLFIPEVPANNLKLTCPYWTPFKIINWLAARSLRSKNNLPDFVFYENLIGGYKFVPVSWLYDNANVNITYVNGTGISKKTADINLDFTTVRDVYTDEQFDFLQRSSSGFYDSRLMTANVVTKSFHINKLEYNDYFNGRPHLNKYPLQATTQSTSRNAAMYSLINPEFGFDGQRDAGHKNWFLQRSHIFVGLSSTFRAEIVVAGRFDIHAGQVVNFNLELIKAHASTDNSTSTTNKYFSGRYLVGAVNHIIKSGGSHSMTLQLVTDSISEKL